MQLSNNTEPIAIIIANYKGDVAYIYHNSYLKERLGIGNEDIEKV